MSIEPEEYLAKLVSYRTISIDLKENSKLLDYVEKQFTEAGLYVKRYTHNGYSSILASTRKNNLKAPRLCLAAHVDVVAGPKNLFTLQFERHKLRGRGAFDMKFATASYLSLLDRIKDNLKDYDLGFMITSDEEVGGHDGVRWLLDQGYKPGFTLLPDHGNFGFWNIEESAKGVMELKVSARGKAGHSSRVWEGENAITKLGKFLYHLNELHFREQGPETSTFSINQIKGGLGPTLTQIPDKAEAYLDFRFISKEDRKRLLTEIERMALICDIKIDEPLIDGPVHAVDMDLAMVQELANCIEDVSGDAIQYVNAYGASDARFFDPKGLLCLVFGLPGGGHHGDDEWVDRNAVRQLDDVLYRYIEKVARFDKPALTKKVKSTTINRFTPETVASSGKS